MMTRASHSCNRFIICYNKNIIPFGNHHRGHAIVAFPYVYGGGGKRRSMGFERKRCFSSSLSSSSVLKYHNQAQADAVVSFRFYSSSGSSSDDERSKADKKELIAKKKKDAVDLESPWRPDWREKVLESQNREIQEQADELKETQQRKEREDKKDTILNVKRALVGNVCIAGAKLGAWMSCGSSALLSEFVHSLVDCGNQALLLIGLRDSGLVADRRHPYGYGKNIYFWSLVSALGTFWLGAGVSLRHSIEELIDPSLADITWQVWGVLGFSLVVDGWVFGKTLQTLKESKPENISLFKHLRTLRDPATLAVLLEDGAACFGIALASAGLCLTQITGLTIYDGAAGVSISLLLAGIGKCSFFSSQYLLVGF